MYIFRYIGNLTEDEDGVGTVAKLLVEDSSLVASSGVPDVDIVEVEDDFDKDIDVESVPSIPTADLADKPICLIAAAGSAKPRLFVTNQVSPLISLSLLDASLSRLIILPSNTFLSVSALAILLSNHFLSN